MTPAIDVLDVATVLLDAARRHVANVGMMQDSVVSSLLYQRALFTMRIAEDDLRAVLYLSRCLEGRRSS